MPEVSRTFSIRPGIEASSRDRVGPLGGDAPGRPGAWVLIGGQMVLLHGLEYDELPVRETVDADLLVNVRALPRGTERLANALQRRGLTIAGMSPDGVGHRFSGGGFNVDVLAADNLGHRANLTTVRPARTLGAPAGTRLVRAPRRCRPLPAARSVTSRGPISTLPSSGRPPHSVCLAIPSGTVRTSHSCAASWRTSAP